MKSNSVQVVSMEISKLWKNKLHDLGQENMNDPKLGMKDVSLINFNCFIPNS